MSSVPPGHRPVPWPAPRLEVCLEPTPAAVGLAREAVGRLEGYADPVARADVRLLVSELVTNAIRHADLRPSDEITLVAEERQGAIRVEVGNRGTGFDVAPSGPAPGQASGFGLYLVDRLAGRWGSTHGSRPASRSGHPRSGSDASQAAFVEGHLRFGERPRDLPRRGFDRRDARGNEGLLTWNRTAWRSRIPPF